MSLTHAQKKTGRFAVQGSLKRARTHYLEVGESTLQFVLLQLSAYVLRDQIDGDDVAALLPRHYQVRVPAC